MLVDGALIPDLVEYVLQFYVVGGTPRAYPLGPRPGVAETNPRIEATANDFIIWFC